VPELDPAAAVDEWWGLDFIERSGQTGGFVRLSRVGDRCWYWAYLVGPAVGLVVVRDHDVPAPRRSGILEVRADSLWAELVCEQPGEHWGFALEAFGVRLDAVRDAWPRDVVEVGERLPVGFDLEWEVVEKAAVEGAGTVHGELLLARDTVAVDGFGLLRHVTAPRPPWSEEWQGWCRLAGGRWSGIVDVRAAPSADDVLEPRTGRLDDGTTVRCEALAVAPVPITHEPAGRATALVRVLTVVRPEEDRPSKGGSGFAPLMGCGWLDVLQSRQPGRSDEP
jgi:hypothetical protein